MLYGTWAQTVAAVFAAITVVYASCRALRSPHLKRRLAYSTVANLSYILLGATMMTPAGLIAAVLHMLFHAVNKITLFFCAGAVFYRTGKEYVYEIAGFGRKIMPVTMFCFTVTGLGLMGIPPLTGFISKWRLGTAAADTGLPIGYLAAGALVLAALLAALYIITVVFLVYFPSEDQLPDITENRDPNWMMKVPLLSLTVIAVMLSLLGAPLTQLLTGLLS